MIQYIRTTTGLSLAGIHPKALRSMGQANPVVGRLDQVRRDVKNEDQKRTFVWPKNPHDRPDLLRGVLTSLK